MSKSAKLLVRELVRQSLAQSSDRLLDANNAPRCMQVKVDGVRCGSPAMRGKPFCYFHDRFLNRPYDDGFPPLENGAAIQWAIMQVLQDLLKKRIDRDDAATLLYGLQTASSNLKHTHIGVHTQNMVLEEPVDEAAHRRREAAGVTARSQEEVEEEEETSAAS